MNRAVKWQIQYAELGNSDCKYRNMSCMPEKILVQTAQWQQTKKPNKHGGKICIQIQQMIPNSLQGKKIPYAIVKTGSYTMWFSPLPPEALWIGIQGQGTSISVSVMRVTRFCVGKSTGSGWSTWTEIKREYAYMVIQFLPESLSLCCTLAQDL